MGHAHRRDACLGRGGLGRPGRDCRSTQAGAPPDADGIGYRLAGARRDGQGGTGGGSVSVAALAAVSQSREGDSRSHLSAIVGPVQEDLPLDRPAHDVAWFAVPFQLCSVSLHIFPTLDLSCVIL